MLPKPWPQTALLSDGVKKLAATARQAHRFRVIQGPYNPVIAVFIQYTPSKFPNIRAGQALSSNF